jgi:uncharacterized membrane protein
LSVPAEQARPGFFQDFSKFFLRGLGALLPTIITIAILIWAYQFVEDYIGKYINGGFIAILARTVGAPKPSTVDPDIDTIKYGTRTNQLDDKGQWLTLEYELVHHKAHGGAPGRPGSESLECRTALWRVAFAKYKLGVVGFLIAISLVYFIGHFVASFIGRTTWSMLERIQERVPLVNAIYPHIKQITDFLLSERRTASGGVVAVEYPRKGIWTVGLLTGGGLRAVNREAGEEMVSVFIPNSPTLLTGFVIMVPRSEILELAVSMDEALRYIITAGVVLPGKEPSAEAIRQGGLALEGANDSPVRPPIESPSEVQVKVPPGRTGPEVRSASCVGIQEPESPKARRN